MMRLPDDAPAVVVEAVVDATVALEAVRSELRELFALREAPAAQVEERRVELLRALTEAHRVFSDGCAALGAWNPHRAEVAE